MGGEKPIGGVIDWARVGYACACAWQAELVRRRQRGEIPDLLILCEHPPVITLGRNAHRENVLLPEAELRRRGIEVHPTNRGGDVTYHGLGQLVGYPIVHLGGLRKDVVWYVRALEEVLIRAVRELGVEATRRAAPTGPPAPAAAKAGPDGIGEGKRQLYTGVWAGDQKLAAIGVHIARWVTSHGFALNVTTDLSCFDFIVPCGLADGRVTSLEQLMTPKMHDPSRSARDDNSVMAAVKQAVIRHFGQVFGRTMQTIGSETWEAWLGAVETTAS